MVDLKILSAYKFNVLAIATHHRKYCGVEEASCVIAFNGGTK